MCDTLFQKNLIPLFEGDPGDIEWGVFVDIFYDGEECFRIIGGGALDLVFLYFPRHATCTGSSGRH